MFRSLPALSTRLLLRPAPSRLLLRPTVCAPGAAPIASPWWASTVVGAHRGVATDASSAAQSIRAAAGAPSEANPSAPGAGGTLHRIVWTQDKGRGLVSLVPLRTGITVFAERPLAAAPNPPFRSTRCVACLAPLSHSA
jgi:hypothetical protein